MTQNFQSMKKKMQSLMVGALALIAPLTFVSGQKTNEFDPPANYYDGTDGLAGQELKLRLHQIIRNHTVRSYSEFRDIILPDLDEDPNNSNNIILFYKNNSIPKTDFAIDDDSWNREHTWPSSHGFPETTDTTYTDAHNLRPSDASVNSSKSNKDFNDIPNIAENAEGEAPDTYTNSDFWDPRDEIKGDVARILFYMSTRYESERLDLEIVDRISFSGDSEIGVLFTLIQWHEQDPVDDAERSRHEGVFGYQGNRNPYVDHPEFVAAVFGSATDPTLIDGQLNFNPDFGKVALGSSLSQTYGLTAYNLVDDVSVTVDAPFTVSVDGTNWTDSIGFVSDNSGAQAFTVHVRFEPAEEGQVATATISNFTDGDTVNISLVGEEGVQEVITIAEARVRELEEVVLVTGVVIDEGNNSTNSRVVYDGTAGIVVRSFDTGNESKGLLQGDSVVVSGGLSEFSNLLQIEESPIVITLLKQNAVLPEPQVVTLADVDESLESQLVKVENVHFEDAGNFAGGGSAGNFTITDGENELVFRIGSSEHPLVGTAIPEGIYNITGIVGQFADDYQLSPRSSNDLEFVSDGTEVPDLISISTARTTALGERVQVTGVVISAGSNSADNRIIYDGTAGIVVRSFDDGNTSAPLVLGDSVVVVGGLSEFSGTLQIEESPITIELLKQEVGLPTPQNVVLSAASEEYESELILVEEVTFSETGAFKRGNYTISDGTNDLIVRIGLDSHPLVGESIPQEEVSITGYLGQTQEDYQLFIRSASDLVVTGEPLGLRGTQELNGLVYPNPITSTFKLSLPDKLQSRDLRVKVLSLEGRELLRFPVDRSEFNVQQLEPGLYIVLIVGRGVGYYDKLIKR